MCDVLHGDGALLPVFPDPRGVRSRGVLGPRYHPAGPYCQIRATLAVYPTGHQSTDPRNHFLHLVSQITAIWIMLILCRTLGTVM